ncbi:MAG: TolC family protein [Holophagales bacterium]|nr:TolC family protein [Holophagales bacterium]
MTLTIERFRNPRLRFSEPLKLGHSAFACLLGALMAAPGAWAEDFEVPTMVGAGPVSYSTLEVGSEGSVTLSLEDAVAEALQHNVSLVVERYTREQSLLGIREALGYYDFNLNADLETSSSTRPPSSQLEDADIVTTDQDRWNFRLNRNSPWGGGASLTFNNTRTESSDAFVQPNPQYVVNLNLGFTQPLLRNRGRDTTERDIIVARNNTLTNRAQFRDQVESVIRQVSDIYWDLVEAKEQLEVSEESLELAKELHEMNRIQVEVGTLAPLEMVQSEVGVATREEEIIRRTQAVEDSEDVLRRLVNLEQGALWATPIQPVTDPAVEHQSIDVRAAVDTAYSRRTDVRQQEISNATLRLDAEVARNQKKPQLDLTAGYGYNAVAGTTDFVDNMGMRVFDVSSYSDALQSIADREFDGWSVALNFSMPLENRAAEARAAIAELAAERGEYQLRDLKDGVLLEVRRTARAVESAAKAIDSAKVSSKLARKNLEAEQKRYENGLSTSFRVLEIQEDLSEAQSREVTAIISYRKALTAFHLATGQLLDEHSVRLSDEERLDVETPDEPASSADG